MKLKELEDNEFKGAKRHIKEIHAIGELRDYPSNMLLQIK